MRTCFQIYMTAPKGAVDAVEAVRGRWKKSFKALCIPHIRRAFREWDDSIPAFNKAISDSAETVSKATRLKAMSSVYLTPSDGEVYESALRLVDDLVTFGYDHKTAKRKMCCALMCAIVRGVTGAEVETFIGPEPKPVDAERRAEDGVRKHSTNTSRAGLSVKKEKEAVKRPCYMSWDQMAMIVLAILSMLAVLVRSLIDLIGS